MDVKISKKHPAIPSSKGRKHVTSAVPP